MQSRSICDDIYIFFPNEKDETLANSMRALETCPHEFQSLNTFPSVTQGYVSILQ